MKNKRFRKNFPKNILVLATHGSAIIPSEVKKNLHESFSTRLQKNFSDFGTKHLLKNIPKNQTVCPKYGRIVGDSNRSECGSDLFRVVDFNNNCIWKKPLTHKQKAKFLRESRQAYLDAILSKIELMCQNTEVSKPIVVLDLHDTGNKLLGVSKNLDINRSQFVMPTAIFSNQNHQTSQSEFLQQMADVFTRSFKAKKSEVQLNRIFLGGFITQFFGGLRKNNQLENILKKYNRSRDSLFVVQCELNRALYLDESNQKIRPEIGRIRNNFEAFLCDVLN